MCVCVCVCVAVFTVMEETPFEAHTSSKTIFIPVCPQLFSKLTKDLDHFCFLESPGVFTNGRNANKVVLFCFFTAAEASHMFSSLFLNF